MGGTGGGRYRICLTGSLLRTTGFAYAATGCSCVVGAPSVPDQSVLLVKTPNTTHPFHRRE